MSDLLTGVGALWRGQVWVARRPRWWLFGLLPALVALVLVGAALTALAWWAGDIVDWATPFAAHWSSGERALLRDTATALLIGVGALIAIVTFTGLTVAIGQPFYERLVRAVLPPPPGAPEIGIGDALAAALRIGFRTALCSVGLFALGCVPVLGQLLAPALGFCVAGYFLTVELTGIAFDLHGVPPRERLRGRRTAAIGFGLPLVLAFLVPFATVLLMPGAVAGAALLVADRPPRPENRLRPPVGSFE
ncbi:EI24 domain-containing protein [Kitasatospora sp. RB6PN24]|uniref:EI24 domain-containing protein n=1 Tax=Kitasatospora humi TaxID=2893891 RepID=UPI001E2FCEDB|nr:EI24 domain-containing protein [Kitasatospora humi]MCC9307280.1 EI24 domain-containing protein [Kitasatospora humi]